MHSRFFLFALFGFFAGLSVLCSPAAVFAQAATPEQRAALQAQLDQIEKDIANNQGTLTGLQKQRTTLERDIAILDNKIKTAQLQIKQSDLALKQLANDISGKQAAIRDVDGKVAQGQEALGQMLRRTREIDDTSLATIVLSTASLSELFREVDNFETLQEALSESFTEMAVLRSDLAERKQSLEEKQNEAQKVRDVQILAKQTVQKDEAAKQAILKATKGQEVSYQKIIADKQQQAAQIRTALFGLRDSAAIPFGTAYEYAKQASVLTGVRPALILAILTQETNLGQNVGSCIVKDLSTGSGVGKNTGKVFNAIMKAPRDTVPYQSITAELGIDWASVPVSCPQSSGYGGAMGPAQFIPSTWALYKDRIGKVTGTNPPDPWNGRTAVFATALLMADNGADAGTRAAEKLAALRYFAGWANARKAAYSFYGTSVMELADQIQENIDVLNN